LARRRQAWPAVRDRRPSGDDERAEPSTSGSTPTAGSRSASVTHADFVYVKVTPGDTDASVTDWRLGADYYFFRNAGLGVQYKYNKYTYDRGILASQLGGEITYKGFQAFLSFLF
jgi:predicted porin